MLTRRTFLYTLGATLLGSRVMSQQGVLKPYRFRVKTATGGIVGTTIMARDQFEAVHKIRLRYKGCEILNLYPPKMEADKKEADKKGVRKRK